MLKNKRRTAEHDRTKRRRRVGRGAAGAMLGLALAAMLAGHSAAQAASRIKLVKLQVRAGEQVGAGGGRTA